MIMTKVLSTLFGGAALVAASSASAVLIVDDFTTEQFLEVSGSTGSVSSQVEGAGILGGERDVYLGVIDNEHGLSADVNVVGGNYHHSTDTGVTAFSTIQWDGIDGSDSIDAMGLSGVDLLSAGSAFVIDVLSTDLGATFELTVWDMDGTFETVFKSVGQVLSPQSVAFNFNSFSSALDLSSVGAMELTLSGAAAVDLSIRSVTVPEPAGIALVGLGLLGLGLRRKSKKA
tara:strand:+ start:2997 stop:3686 length:690 start_codon:yes stop_codon:yes gene_type:complete